jgi:hypothetical protein
MVVEHELYQVDYHYPKYRHHLHNQNPHLLLLPLAHQAIDFIKVIKVLN